MNINGILFRVKGKTLSPFHTTRRAYTSLVQTAPFVLGSTLRGALLSTIIRQINCPERVRLQKENDSINICKIHLNCEASCFVKHFFSPYQVLFSFGKFCAKEENLYQRIIRIAIEREKVSVAEGAIVNIEAIQAETPFEFEIMLLGKILSFKEEIKKAINNIAVWEGIGRYQSIGFGQIQIDDIEEIDLSQAINHLFYELKEKLNHEHKMRLVFKTPLVLGDENGTLFSFSNRVELIEQFSKEIVSKVQNITGRELTPLVIKDVEMKIIPDYVHRFSYEIKNKENRLIAASNSEVILHFENISDEVFQQFAIVSFAGLGEWSDWGFGRFEMQKGITRNNG